MVEGPNEWQRSHAYTQGIAYLHRMQSLALAPNMVGGLGGPDEPAIACWIGTHYPQWNGHLQTLVQACHECFYPHARPPVQIFAVPLAAAFGLDGICNYRTHPIAILVDLGRVRPADWRRLVVHEYAHAQVGTPGHHDRFASSLTHLCRGLALEAPPPDSSSWSHWPPCHPTPDALAFWRGQSGPFASLQ